MVKRTVEIEVKTTGEQSVNKLERSVESLNSDIAKTSKVSQGVNNALNKNSKGLGNFSRASGQAGIQLQQFIGQVQGGQSALLALSQQSADLGFVLGAPLLGAVAGISASLVGILLPSLLETKDATKLLEVITEDLSVSLGATSEGVNILSDNLLKLSERSEALAKLQISSSIQDAEKQISTSAEGIEQVLDDAFGSTTESVLRGFGDEIREAASKTTGSLDLMIQSLSEGSAAGLAFGKEAKILDTIKVISSQFNITRKQAVELSLSISDIFKNQSVGNIKTFENVLSDLNIETGGSNKAIGKLAKALIPLFDATSDGVDKLNLLRQAFGDFSRKADESDKGLIKYNENLGAISESIKSQIIALEQGEEASFRYLISQKLGLEVGEKIPGNIEDQIVALFKLKDAKKELTDQERKDAAEKSRTEREESSIRRGFASVESGAISDEDALALKLAKDLELTFQYSQLGIEEEARALEIKRQLAEKYYADLAKLRADDSLGQVISSAQSVNSFIGSLQQINDKSKGLKKAAIVSNTAVAVMETYSRLGYPWGIPAAAAVAAIGVKQLSQVGKQSYSGSAGGGDSAGFSTPTVTEESTVTVTENTAVTDLTNELRNRDPEEPLTVDFTRRIIAAVTDAQTSGQA